MGRVLIERAPRKAAGSSYDLVVVGGGIYGAMAVLEAARRGYRTLLLERDDFGGATSWNHHRILHGGLRYLQSLDLRRFRESVAERGWLMRRFPELVAPLSCLMPLYGRALRRPAALRVALALNDLLSRDRNRGLPEELHLPSGGVLTPDETAERFADVRRDGLAGAALWYDASLERPQRLILETLRWACAAGATCLNYVEVTGLDVRDGRVAGVAGVDRTSGEALRFPAGRVLNCAGPWSRSVARASHADFPRLFRPSLAFNLLLDRPPPSPDAVAVEPPYPGARTYFLRPWRGRILAGTYHAPLPDPGEDSIGLDSSGGDSSGEGPRDGGPSASPEQVEAFLRDLGLAVPGLEVGPEAVIRVYAGFLPVREAGTVELTTRPVILDHGRAGGAEGLVSVSGVKLTTARAVAERAVRRTFGRELRGRAPEPAARSRPEPSAVPSADAFLALLAERPAEAADRLRRLAADEAVVHPEDLLWRRTDWSEDPAFDELRERVPDLLSGTAGLDLPAGRAAGRAAEGLPGSERG